MSDDAGRDEDAEELGIYAKAALFSHVGVNDPEDWRTVVLRLAERYEPGLWAAMQPLLVPAPATPPGRPTEWDDRRLLCLLDAVERVKDLSRQRSVRPDLATDRAACRFIIGDRSHQALWLRSILDLKPGISPRTLENKLKKARERKRLCWDDHGNL